MRNIIRNFGIVTSLLSATAASAGLIGTTTTLRYDYGSLASTFDTWLVSDSIEATCIGVGSPNAHVCFYLTAPQTTQTVDIADNSLAYQVVGVGGHFTPILPNSFNFLSLNPGFAIGKVQFTSNIPGMNASRMSFSQSSLSVNMSGLGVTNGQGWRATLLPVPEPATTVLWFAGLCAILGGFGKKKQSNETGASS